MWLMVSYKLTVQLKWSSNQICIKIYVWTDVETADERCSSK